MDNQLLETIGDFFREKESLFLSSNSINAIFQSRIASFPGDHVVILNSIPPAIISQFIKGTQYVIQFGLARFVSEEIHSDGKNIVFYLDKFSPINDNRQDTRIPFESHEKVCLQLINPLDNETVLVKPIIEMSSAGLSIRASFDSKLFEPGVTFNGLKVLVDGKLYSQSKGKVIYKRAFYNQKGVKYFQIGFQLMS